ncbi:MAG: radical SAM protein [Candidatus Woesearchaeota archaeon]
MTGMNYLVDGERAIISLGGRCDYGCRYCYTYEPGFKGFAKKTPAEIIPTLQELPKEVKLVQCGYDNEFFQEEDEAVELIKAIAESGLNVTFSTKKDLSLETIVSLRSIHEQMQHFQFMVGCVSLLGFETARILEPNAPDPYKRIETIRRLYFANIPTLVYLRPLIPMIPDEEIEEVFAQTTKSCNGYVIGKMIFDERNADMFNLPRTNKKIMTWSKDHREWYEFSDPRAKELAERPNVFLHRSDALSAIVNDREEE